jgi:hypothetical protein
MEIMDYPFTPRLMKALKEEYDKEALEKGDSWRYSAFTNIKYLIDKSTEEHLEMLTAKGYSDTSDEVLDEILVLMMLWERLK